MDEERIADIADMFAQGLDHPVSQQKIREFAAVQAEFQAHQVMLASKAMSNGLSPEVYAAELGKAMQQLARSGESLFGFEDFHKVFGEFRVKNLFETATPVSKTNQA